MSVKGGSVPNTPAPASARQNARPDVAKATSVAQVRATLLALHSRHAQVTTEMDDIIASHAQIARHLSRLDLSRARLGTLANVARSFSHGQLAPAAATASRLSDAVARLDLEQERVKDTLAVVEQVSELKACVLGVVGSMGGPQNWETAAEYIHRASRIPRDVIESGFAEENVPTAEVPEPPAVTLDEAAKSLCNLFLREFEKAVADGDGARITRFFKMFPLIGRLDQGLDAYGRYVCQGVAVRARSRLQGIPGQSGGAPYVAALTKLFEHIAQVVDGHTNLVQRHYGAGTMVKVMERLHAEADVQGGIILDTWSDERSVDRKMTDVKSYAYTFLVHSFLAAPRGNATPRSQSPMPAARVRPPQDESDDGIDMKEVDQVLSEITAMLGNWSLYVRFISSRATEPHSAEVEGAESAPLQMPSYFTGSNLPKKIGRLLLEPFNAFSTFFLRRSVEKAFQLEEKPTGLSLNPNKPPPSNSPFITSSVDDVMYMVNQVLQRSLATSQAGVVSSVVANIGRVLSADFIGMIQRKMRDESYPKAAVQGTAPPEDKVISFMLLSNNLDVATDYLRRIVRSHFPEQQQEQTNGSSHARPLEELFPMGRDAHIVRTALLNLESTFCSKSSDLIDDSVTVIFSHVLLPRIRPFLTEVFRDADYQGIEERDDTRPPSRFDEDNAEGEEQTLTSSAQVGWQGLVAPMKKILTTRNSERLMSTAISYLASLLEKKIWSYSGRLSGFGAIQLEQDVATIANVAVKGENFRMRESFNRCLQIASIMNMEDEEWEEIELAEAQGQDSETIWAINERERRRARNMVQSRE